MARILLIDDDDSVRKALRLALTHSGHTVTEARNGKEGLKLLPEVNADVLITDIVMPEMTGIELAISIRRDMPDCKVLLFSGKLGALELIQKAEKSGHNLHLLEKPVHPTKLIEAMRAL